MMKIQANFLSASSRDFDTLWPFGWSERGEGEQGAWLSAPRLRARASREEREEIIFSFRERARATRPQE